MAMGPERSKPLHNFSMPRLKWGNQRLLRCMKVDSNGEITSFQRRFSASGGQSEGSVTRRREFASLKRRYPNGLESLKKSQLPPIGASAGKSKTDKDVDDGLEEIRAKLELHLRTAADKLNAAMQEVGEQNEAPAAAARPWNLRTRRAACKAPVETTASGGGRGSRNEERQQNSSSLRTGNSTMKSNRMQGVAAAQGVEKEKKERPKFSISLSREEIEEDFLTMTRTRPPRRPKKRPKIIQNQLDANFPGLWLTEVTPDSYKVPDLPERGKR
ncbi:PREDICTED: uncharacterized protein LOC104595181 [Nelumbo nucifera]|uniref:Uncharacterized protein n=2 Tax=Nelumbo nucifera TaxID=4432 RepID=A0A822XZ45_NELNU|nr:PREDICTED: uncharacterized protein LOC104595181 [Nelumbo nucifera]DAD26904.1 TPA_asm: hypothetical protein HUJ06_028372 [Nelumbo nucifera]